MENNIIPLPEKYILTKKFEIEEELKIYFMGVIANPTVSLDRIGRNRNVGVIAYNHPAALKRAMDVWGKDNVAINSYDGDFTLIKDILKVVDHEGVVIQNIIPEIEKPKLMPKESFKFSLILACEEYIKNKKDKNTLKRIISNL